MSLDNIASQLVQRRLQASALEEEENLLHVKFVSELVKLEESVESLQTELRASAESSREKIGQLQTQVDVLKRQNAALLDQTHYLQCQLDQQFPRTKFNHLPVEIRVMIWKLAAGESPNNYKVHSPNVKRDSNSTEYHFKIKCPRQPSVTQVCRESRAVLLPKRQREIVSLHRELGSNQQVVPNSAGISIIWKGILTWFDPAKDVILLPPDIIPNLGPNFNLDLVDILSAALTNLQERVGPLKHIIFPLCDRYMMRNLFRICRNLRGLDSIGICLEQVPMPCLYRAAVMTLLGDPFPSAVYFKDDRLIDIEETIRAGSDETTALYGKTGRVIGSLDSLRTREYGFPLVSSHLGSNWLLRPVYMQYDWQRFEEKFPMAWAAQRLAPIEQDVGFGDGFQDPESVGRGEPFSEEEVRRLKKEARRAPRLKRVVVLE